MGVRWTWTVEGWGCKLWENGGMQTIGEWENEDADYGRMGRGTQNVDEWGGGGG
jgi:hypothetical protein